MPDIHQSDLDSLIAKVAKKNYQKYLLEINIESARKLRGQTIRFDFPVTALIGTNGGGKSTILGAAAIAYKSIKPGEFFPKSNVGDTSMSNWRIEYKTIDRTLATNAELQRNARFVSLKWRRDELLEREVKHFPIKRTVPASEQTRYKKFIGIYELSSPQIDDLPLDVARYAGEILARDLSGYKIARENSSDVEYILLGKQKEDSFSQFHFGAGEASVIEMVMQIETAQNQSLVLIEEIENGLHPKATEKMVEYLIDVAKRKSLQVIFTTHSDNALKRLPAIAKWAAIDGRVVQGNLSIDSLRALSGTIYRDRVIFTEDEFARDWVSDIIRQYCSEIVYSTEIHAAGGFPFIVDVVRHHNQNPTRIADAIAVIDGDIDDADSRLTADCVKLPPGVPEGVVWKYIDLNKESLVGLIQQRCHIPSIDQDKIIKIITEVTLSTGDHHLLFKRFADELGYMSEIVIRKALISIYNEKNASEVEKIVDSIRSIRILRKAA